MQSVSLARRDSTFPASLGFPVLMHLWTRHLAVSHPVTSNVEPTSDLLTDWHEQSFWILVGCIALHITANTLYELVFRQPLVRAMITGRKPVPRDAPAPRLRPAWWALPALAVAAGAVWYVVTRV